MKHTPGPYEIEWKDAQEARINAPNGDPDLHSDSWTSLAVFYGEDDDPYIGHQKAESNARLFIAAPEMYEALKGLGPILTVVPYTQQWEREAVKSCLAAIAKAEGVTK